MAGPLRIVMPKIPVLVSRLLSSCVQSWKSVINDVVLDLQGCGDEHGFVLYIQTPETEGEMANQIYAGDFVQPDGGESIRACTRREYSTAV